ncbi:hypothetical protein [Natronosalvus rutilus]|uniref:Ig-like domain-containing protein n=1 Tax=Natronosalvus rutilus TaxID=2953753 RepID=A0A9E7SVJ2_9EURY|nr:hypothetical protein [Natronosalvus rutilus]UTF54550.1 hypothetical protein NGM29_04555 [Natronosalvus rutilus]
MNRRHFLAATGIGGTLSISPTGRLGNVPSSATFDPHPPAPTDPPTLTPGPEEPPERPAEVTAEHVSAYVSGYEHALTYNTLECRNLQEIDVASDAVLEAETNHGVYAFAVATGYSRCGAGSEPEHRDYGPPPIEWAVGEGYAVRIGDDATEHRVADRTFGADHGDGRASGFAVTNFDHLAHDVTVTMTHEGDTANEETVDLEPRSAVHVRNVSAVRGDHGISIETDEGATTAGTWTVDPNRSASGVIRVLATGEVSIERRDPYGEF